MFGKRARRPGTSGRSEGYVRSRRRLQGNLLSREPWQMLRRQFPAYSCLERSSGFCGRRYLISHEEHRDRAADNAFNICGMYPCCLSPTSPTKRSRPHRRPRHRCVRSRWRRWRRGNPLLIRNRSCGRRIRGRRTVGSWRAQMWVHVMFPSEVTCHVIRLTALTFGRIFANKAR